MSAGRTAAAFLAALRLAPEAIEALGSPPRIYDAAPQGAAFPYAALGRVASRAWNAGGVSGEEIDVELIVLSREDRAACDAAAEALTRAGERVEFEVAGRACLGAVRVGGETRREKDGRTWRAGLRFRVLVHDI